MLTRRLWISNLDFGASPKRLRTPVSLRCGRPFRVCLAIRCGRLSSSCRLQAGLAAGDPRLLPGRSSRRGTEYAEVPHRSAALAMSVCERSASRQIRRAVSGSRRLPNGRRRRSRGGIFLSKATLPLRLALFRVNTVCVSRRIWIPDLMGHFYCMEDTDSAIIAGCF